MGSNGTKRAERAMTQSIQFLMGMMERAKPRVSNNGTYHVRITRMGSGAGSIAARKKIDSANKDIPRISQGLIPSGFGEPVVFRGQELVGSRVSLTFGGERIAAQRYGSDRAGRSWMRSQAL